MSPIPLLGWHTANNPFDRETLSRNLAAAIDRSIDLDRISISFVASVLQGSESIPYADIDLELGFACRPNNSTFGAADSQSIDDLDKSYD